MEKCSSKSWGVGIRQACGVGRAALYGRCRVNGSSSSSSCATVSKQGCCEVTGHQLRHVILGRRVSGLDASALCWLDAGCCIKIVLYRAAPGQVLHEVWCCFYLGFQDPFQTHYLEAVLIQMSCHQSWFWYSIHVRANSGRIAALQIGC
jgi:hypothetical protein